MKLFTKNFLYTTTIIFVVTTMLLGILYVSMPKYYLYTQEKETSEKFNKAIKQLEGQSIETINKKLAEIQNKESKLFYTLSNEKTQRIIFPNQDEMSSETIVLFSTNQLMEFPTHSIQKTIKDNKGTKLIVVAQYSLQQISDASNVLLSLYPFLLITALVLGSIAAFLYSKYSTKRILSLMETTTEMMDLNPRVSCHISGEDEISQLADNINNLYDTHLRTISALKKEVKKVEEIEQSKSNFMRMASHELKTPLAGMTGIVDGLIYNVGKFKDRDTYLSVCQNLLKEQADLIQNILSVTSLDSIESLQEVSEDVSLKSIVEKQLETYLLLEDLGEYKISKELMDGPLIRVNPLMVERVVSNILSNAFRYTPKGKNVYVHLQGNELIVENDCDEIQIDSIHLLFEPFYRFDSSRNKESGGTGLGLYIVKQIVDKNDWDIELDIAKRNRFVVKIQFTSNRNESSI